MVGLPESRAGRGPPDRSEDSLLMLDRLAKLGLSSACVLPLSTAHRKLGSLSFTSRLEDAYSLDEQRFLSLVANQIAVALQLRPAASWRRITGVDLVSSLTTCLPLFFTAGLCGISEAAK